MSEQKPPEYKRRVAYQEGHFGGFIHAAREYVDRLTQEEKEYLFRKPYDPMPHNRSYYQNMYGLLGLIQAMNIKPYGRILEVGSGPGWVTEILIGLGYSVEALEPSETFIEIARERINSFVRHLRLVDPPEAVFHCSTLEECSLPPGSFDAVLFFDALHHIVEEDAGLEQCYQLLCPGGVIGIHENAWVPGDEAQEKVYREAMERFGTLENPFTAEYLDHLLAEKGFIQIERYHQINGLFPESMENVPLGQAAQVPSRGNNIITAIRSCDDMPTTEDPHARTCAEIKVMDTKFHKETQKLELKIYVKNTGDTLWLNRHSSRGVVSIALFRGTPGEEDFQEANWRTRIPRPLFPGDHLELTLTYQLPLDHELGQWKIDLINEGFFWFAHKGMTPSGVTF